MKTMFRAAVLSGLMMCSALAGAQVPDDFDEAEFEGPGAEAAAEPEASPPTADPADPVAPAPDPALPLGAEDEFDDGLGDTFDPAFEDEFDDGSSDSFDVPVVDDEAAGDGPSAGAADVEGEAPLPLPSAGPGTLAPRRTRATPPNSASSQAAPPPPPAPGTPAETHEIVSEASIRQALQRRADAAMIGDDGAARRAMNELLEVKRNLGLRNIPVAASLLLHDARSALASDQLDRAVDLAEAATQMAPELPATHWTLAVALARTDPTQVVQIGGATAQALRSWVVPFRNAITFAVWLASAIGLGFVVAALGFTAVQLAKYLRYLAHDISRRLTGVFGIGEFALLFLALIAMPFALGVGLVTSVALALGLLFAYQTGRERLTSAAVLAGMAVTPVVLQQSAPFVLFHGSRIDALVAAYTENLSPEIAARLDGLAKDDSGERLTYARIHAHRARQRGDLAEARRWYETVVQAAPSDPSALNNLAVLQFLDGDQEAARANFEAAARSDRAEPRLNYSLLLADEGQFSEADALLLAAREIDPQLTEAFTSLDGVRPAAQRFVEVPLPNALLWARFFDVAPRQRGEVLEELWYPLGGKMPPWGFLLVVAASIGLGMYASRFRSSLSVPCSKCGRPAPGTPGAPYCEQCVSVFVSGVAVEPRVRQQKEVEVRRYQRRRRWAERLSSPTGFGLVIGGRPLLGVGLAFVIGFAVGGIALLPLLGVSAWSQPVGGEARALAIGSLALLGLAAAAYSVAQSWER